MTGLEKQIYNIFLGVSKKINDKPVRYRKQFADFEESENYIYIHKLASFFTKFNHINIKDFIEAPYFVYNEKYFDLKFYCTHRAVKTYTAYNDIFLLNNPDSDNTIDKIKESIEFIYCFCKDNNIDISQYIHHVDGQYNSFLKHIKDRNINFYIIFSYPDIDAVINQYDNEVKNMFSSNFSRMNYIRTKFLTSSRAKKIINNFKRYIEKSK